MVTTSLKLWFFSKNHTDRRKLDEITFHSDIVLPRQSSCGSAFCYGNIFFIFLFFLLCLLYHLSVLFTVTSPAPSTLPTTENTFSICGIYTSVSKVTGDDRGWGSLNI